jgi:hypothetical protein
MYIIFIDYKETKRTNGVAEKKRIISNQSLLFFVFIYKLIAR